jgi:hypothetical protein
MTDQLILGDHIGQGWQEIDFGGLMDWQRNDVSPVVIKGGGKYRFRNFQAALLGGLAMIEIQLPNKRSRLPDDWELEIELLNILAGAQDAEPLPWHTAPRLVWSGNMGHITRFKLFNVQTHGMAGIALKGNYLNRVAPSVKAIDINRLVEYDPNPNIFNDAGKVITFEEARQAMNQPDADQIIKQYAAKMYNEANGVNSMKGNMYSRHAIGIRAAQDVAMYPEKVHVRNVIINTMQTTMGDEIRQLLNIYHDLNNFVLVSHPSTISRDENGAIISSGVVVENVVTVGHATPEIRNDGCPFQNDAVKGVPYDDSGPLEAPDGQQIKNAAHTLFKNCLSIGGMNIPLSNASKNGNFFTNCRAVGLGDKYFNTDVDNTWSSVGAAQWMNPTNNRANETEFSGCKVAYKNTRPAGGIKNFMGFPDGAQRWTVINPKNYPEGIPQIPYTGPRANEWIDFEDDGQLLLIAVDWANWFTQYLDEALHGQLPFADTFDPNSEGIGFPGDSPPDPSECELELEQANQTIADLQAIIAEKGLEIKALNAEIKQLNQTIASQKGTITLQAAQIAALESEIQANKVIINDVKKNIAKELNRLP